MAYISDGTIKIIILLTIFAVIYQIYNYFYKSTFINQIKIADIPLEVKCFFKEPNCEEGDLDGWSIVYFLIYFIIGLVIPDQYITIVVILVFIEIVKPLGGYKPKYFINPLIGLTGYSIGSFIMPKNNKFVEKYSVLENKA